MRLLKFNQIMRINALVALFFMVAASLLAQGRSVSGVVTDENGEPLIGVSVLENGTTNGTVTDIDGKFSLSAKNNKPVLKISYLGYESVSTQVTSSVPIRVTMEENKVGLEEVVITGYGKVVSKDKLTASISKVSSKVLESGVRSNPLTALAGTVSGVRVTQINGQPGKSPSILVRGGASLDGKGDPLYIIDGMQRDDMSDINSNDIESIEVLKDAAATALYGARANNGVVLITTKTGRVGRAEITLKVNVGRNFMRNTEEFLGAADYLKWGRLGVMRSRDMSSDTAPLDNLLNGATPYGTGNNINADGNKTTDGVWSTMFLTDENRYLLSQGWKTTIDPITGRELIFNEYSSRDGSFQEAWTQEYNLSMTGGNDKGKYYSSLGYYDETGLPLGTFYRRFSFNLNGEYKIRNWLTAYGSANISKSGDKGIVREDNEYEYFGILQSSPPTMRQYNPAGELIVGPSYGNGNWTASIDKFYRRSENFRGTFSTSLKIDFTKFLYLKLNGMVYMNVRETESFNKAYISAPGNLNTDRNASAGYSRNLNQTYNAILGYNQSFGKHSISAVGGFEFFDKYTYGLSASGKGADSDDFINLQYTTALLRPGETKTSRNMSTTHLQERILSGFINASYDYAGKYLFAFSGRLDGYSKLINNRWGFFPGVSAAWNIYKEDFMQPHLDIVTSLKLRASFGQNGNVNMVSGVYDLQGNFGTTASYNGNYGFLINKLPYPDLRWEKTTSFDVAAEFRFIDRIGGSIGFFNKETSDLLASVPFPTSAGVGNMLTNNGSVLSQGLEVDLDVTLIQNKNLKWRIGANMTYLRSRILSLPNNGNENNRQGGSQVYNPQTGGLMWVGGYQEGQEYGAIYAYEKQTIVRDDEHLKQFANYVDKVPTNPVYGPEAYARLTDEQKKSAQKLAPGDVVWVDVNGDGEIDLYDQTSQGRQVPMFTGGFDTSLDYKGFSIFARFDYAAGYKSYNSRRAWYLGMMQGTFNNIADVSKTWTEENRGAEYPVVQYADQNYKNNYNRSSSMFWEDASYFCAREITLSYSFPKKWMNAIYLSDLTLSVTGQNLFYVTASNLYSPEYGASKEGGYPIPRSVLMGLKVSF